MGQGWGHVPFSGVELYLHPEVTPGPNEEPTFDPNLGFASARKKREMMVTEAEMESVKLPLENRDYCAHLVMKFMLCRRDNFPWVVACEHEKHAYLNCMYDDYVIRAKEYERERRLRVREQKMKHSASTELASEDE